MPEGTTNVARSVVTGNFVPAQRDVLLMQGLAQNADVIVMCDDDMVLPPDALSSLCGLLRSDAAIGLVGALYYSRDGLRPMIVDGWNPSDTREGWIPAFDDRTPIGVSGVGFGCVAIRAAAVRGFSRPYFASQVYVEHGAARVRVCNEDYLFCARVRDAGYAVVLHPGVRCGHYDRSRNVIAPAEWESVERTNIKRVVVQSGQDYQMLPMTEATDVTVPEAHLRANVVYVETGLKSPARHSRNVRTLYLHVGTHKTGTTSLQTFLTLNAAALASQGIYIPRAGRPVRHFGSTYVGHHNVAWELANYVQYQAPDGGLVQLADEITKAQASSIVISSEDFEFLHTKPDLLARLSQTFSELGYTTNVIIYLRPQPDYLQAIYSEHSKAGHLIKPESYLDGTLRNGNYVPVGAVDVYTGINQFEYGPLVGAFAAAFGSDRIIVRPYLSGRNPNALLDEFLGLIGAGALPHSALVRPGPLNVSSSIMNVLAGVYAGIRQRNPDAPTPEQLVHELFPVEQHATFTKKFDVLLPGELRALLERFAGDNARIEKAYGTRISFQAESDLPQRDATAWAGIERQRRLLDTAITHWTAA